MGRVLARRAPEKWTVEGGIDEARNLRAAAVKITEDSDPAKQWTWALGEER